MTSEYPFIMVIETSDYLHRLEANQFNLFTQKLHNSLSKTLNSFEGQIIEHNDNKYVIGFSDVSNAVLAALKIQSKFKYITPTFDSSIRRLKISICHAASSLESSVKNASNICELVKDQIVITSEVKGQYEKENNNSFLDRRTIRILKPSEFAFIRDVMQFLESQWNNYELSVEDLVMPLGYSSSQIYRKMKSLTGKSPSVFIRDYRLNRALQLIHDRKGSIGRIARISGFKSPTYFSKCFKERFGLLASKYVQQHAV